MTATPQHIKQKLQASAFVAALVFFVVGGGLFGCHPSGNRALRQSLISGVERALTEPETLTYGTYVKHGDDLVVKAYCLGRRDGSGEMKVFEKDDRLIYELVTRADEAPKSMHLVERNLVSGETLEYDVPQDQYYDISYDTRMHGPDGTAPYWGCLLGGDWQSWITPRNDFRSYLVEQIQGGRLRMANRGGEAFILVEEPRLGFELAHEFYFDPQDHLLHLWRTVHDKDPQLTRDRVYVYCDHISEAQCMSMLDLSVSRLVSPKGDVR